MRLATALIYAVAALLIACSSQSTSTVPQVGNEPNNDTATTTTGLPTATPAAETTTAQPVPSATVEPTNRPTPTTAPETQPETATSTTATTVLRVTVSAVPDRLPDYDRDNWKHWTDADRDCQDARNEVLIAESRTAVAYRTDRKCRVTTGEWLAPYSNTVAVDPGKLDVDHMVPLGNVHDSGAWKLVGQSERAIRQLPGGSSASHRRRGQREPFQGCTRTGPMETGRPNLLVPVRR